MHQLARTRSIEATKHLTPPSIGRRKCNPEKASALEGLVKNINACDTSKCDVYVCPSNLHIGIVYKDFTNGAKIAPQNCNCEGAASQTPLGSCWSASARVAR